MLFPEVMIAMVIFYVFMKLRVGLAAADDICASQALVESIANAPIHG